MPTTKPATVDEYLATFTDSAAIAAMQSIRATIFEAVPVAEECTAYAIPTYKHKGKSLVHFGGFKMHIGFYATPTGHEEFAKELGRYKQGKGSVQFPLSDPMPLDLIKRIVKFRLAEVSGKK